MRLSESVVSLNAREGLRLKCNLGRMISNYEKAENLSDWFRWGNLGFN